MSKKVLIATVKPFAPAAVEKMTPIFQQNGYDMKLLEAYQSDQEFIEAVSDCDALVVRSDKVTPAVLDNAGNLKIVVRAGAGYDNIDLEHARNRGVVVMNTPGQNANAVAELVVGMMVYHARNQFNGKPGGELFQKTLGLHAYGNVGRHVARIAQGFGMSVCAFDPFLEDEVFTQAGLERVTRVEDLYSSCRYVSLHLPANDETRDSINYMLLSMMPEGATLVNAARKEIVNEDDLLKIFAARDDFSYLSDIAPDCSETIVRNYPGRYYFTPKKMGAQTAEANINAGIAAASQIVAFFEEGDETFRVN